MNKSGISFSVPVLPKKSKLKPLRSATTDFIGSKLVGRERASFPPRSLHQILKIIENDAAEAITIMEWLKVFKASDDWRFNNKADETRACLLVWTAISKNNSVSQIAFFKSALALDLNDNSFPLPLIETATVAKPCLNSLDKKKVNWIEALRTSDYLSCAIFVYSSNLTVKQYIYSLGLPDATQYINQVCMELVNCIAHDLTDLSENWLFRCMQEAPSTGLKVELCNSYLGLDPEFIKNDELDTWFEINCLPDSENSYFFKLNDHSKRSLKKLYNFSEFYKFIDLVTLMSRPKIANALKVTDEEIKQLKSRVDFWSNYSERFIQVKLLIPAKTGMLLKHFNQTLDNYSLLTSDDSENSEVCIFEFENTLVVEIFRGVLSEIRFFEKSDRNVQRLLLSDSLSIAEIRNMVQDDIHDHVVLWQYFCEKSLRTKMNILPNEGLEFFAGLPKKIAKYSWGMKAPLAKPLPLLLRDRKEQLEIWNHAFWNREFNTQKYEGLSAKELDVERQFNEINALRSLDNKQFESGLITLANSGHKEATFLLAQQYLKNPKNAHQGQDFLIKSANLGHVKATELAEKYGIPLHVQTTKLTSSIESRNNDLKTILESIEILLNSNKSPIFGSELYNGMLNLLSEVTIRTASDKINNPLRIFSRLHNSSLGLFVNALMINNEIIPLKKLNAFLENGENNHYFFERGNDNQYILETTERINKHLRDAINKPKMKVSTERKYLSLSAGEITKKVKECESNKNYPELKLILSEVRLRNTRAAVAIKQNIEQILMNHGQGFQ